MTTKAEVKAWAVKDPKGNILLSTFDSDEGRCIQRFVYNQNEGQRQKESWKGYFHANGYSCVPVLITEVKEQNKMRVKTTDLIQTIGGLLIVALPFILLYCIWFPSGLIVKICLSDIALILCLVWIDKYINDPEPEETEE